MSYPIYIVPAGDVIPHLFSTFDGGTGASITMTGLAVTDIEIYKDGGVTQRASDAGYTLLDTDGIDFDGITGIHGFSIDTGDNTDAGFYTVGSWFHVVVSTITVDGQTVSFVACAFRLLPAEAAAGVPDVNVTHLIDADLTADGPIPLLGILDQGTAQSATATTLVGRAAGAFANDTIIGSILVAHGSTQGYWQVRVITDVDLATDTFTVDTWTVTPSGTITYKIFAGAPASTSLPIPVNVTQFGGSAGTFASGRPEVKTSNFEAGAITAAAFGSGAIDAAAIAADAVTKIQNGLATQATADAIETDTQNIQSRLPASLNNGVMPADVQRVNDVEIVGDGSGTPFNVA